MTNEEAIRAVSVLAAYFPSRLPAETVTAWAMELERYEQTDVISAVRRVCVEEEHPSLAAIVKRLDPAYDPERKSRESGLGLGSVAYRDSRHPVVLRQRRRDERASQSLSDGSQTVTDLIPEPPKKG